MSIDGTREIIKSFQKNNSNIILLDNPDQFVPSGFNHALSQAKGDVIIRVDGHSFLESNYIINCLNCINGKRASAVGGLINPTIIGIMGNSNLIATSSKFGVGNSKFHYSTKGLWTETVYMGAWKREVFEEKMELL